MQKKDELELFKIDFSELDEMLKMDFTEIDKSIKDMFKCIDELELKIEL